MAEKKFYIRFGLHRDRDMLRFLKDDYAGIVLPAHILAYSSKATIAAMRYIGKPYFIDPMTYIYARGFLDGYKVYKEDDQQDHLKPSISKLTKDLSLETIFGDIDTQPLDISDLNDTLITKIAEGNVNLQLNRINEGLESSTPKLDALLSDIGQPPSQLQTSYTPPVFVTSPYFLIPKENTDAWIDINVKLARETRRLTPDEIEVRPIILTYIDLLDSSLLNKYDGFSNFITWVEDLEESKSCSSDSQLTEQVRKLTRYKELIINAKASNKTIINLYGSYFSAILIKEGLEAFSNGPLYGEYKSSSASLGGIPPVRIYLPALHRFYIYSQAIELIQRYPALYEGFPSRSKELFPEPAQLAKILDDIALAQEHFINCRNQEIEGIEANDMTTILDALETMHDSIGPFDQKPLKGKEPHQLVAWHKALSASLDQ